MQVVLTLKLLTQRYPKFDFLEKRMGVVSPPHFVFDLSRKMFLMLYFIN